MEVLRQLGVYAVLIAVIWALTTYIPRCSRVQPPQNYDDVNGIDTGRSYNLDPTVDIGHLAIGDAICYRLGDDGDESTYFGWIAALPGDKVAIKGQELIVNGAVDHRGAKMSRPDTSEMVIPAGHFFVVTSSHIYDSTSVGPLDRIALRGRLAALP